MDINCRTCLFGDRCYDPECCEHYTPLDDWDEAEVEKYIEDERVEFYGEWQAYLKEHQGSYSPFQPY